MIGSPGQNILFPSLLLVVNIIEGVLAMLKKSQITNVTLKTI